MRARPPATCTTCPSEEGGRRTPSIRPADRRGPTHGWARRSRHEGLLALAVNAPRRGHAGGSRRGTAAPLASVSKYDEEGRNRGHTPAPAPKGTTEGRLLPEHAVIGADPPSWRWCGAQGHFKRRNLARQMRTRTHTGGSDPFGQGPRRVIEERSPRLPANWRGNTPPPASSSPRLP